MPSKKSPSVCQVGFMTAFSDSKLVWCRCRVCRAFGCDSSTSRHFYFVFVFWRRERVTDSNHYVTSIPKRADSSRGPRSYMRKTFQVPAPGSHQARLFFDLGLPLAAPQRAAASVFPQGYVHTRPLSPAYNYVSRN